MSEVWYKSKGFKPYIEKVIVDRYTDTSVWINGRRSSRRSSYVIIDPDRDIVKDHILSELQLKIDSYEFTLKRLKDEFEEKSAL